MGNLIQVHHQFSGAVTLAGFEAGGTLLSAALAVLLAHCLERPDSSLVASAPRLDALAYPHLFLGELLVKQLVGSLLSGELLFPETQKALIATFELIEMATVDLDNLVRDIL